MKKQSNESLVATQMHSQSAKPNVSTITNRLTKSEIESLRHDLKESSAYFQKFFSQRMKETPGD